MLELNAVICAIECESIMNNTLYSGLNFERFHHNYME